MGELNITIDTLYNMTPRNFINAQNGSKKLYEQNQQAEWERARWMACVIINPHLKKSVDPKKITIFPWEKQIKKTSDIIRDQEKILKESMFDDAIQKKLKENA